MVLRKIFYHFSGNSFSTHKPVKHYCLVNEITSGPNCTKQKRTDTIKDFVLHTMRPVVASLEVRRLYQSLKKDVFGRKVLFLEIDRGDKFQTKF